MRSTTSLENPVGFIGNLARALVIGLLASVLTLVPAAQEAKATGAIEYNDNDCQLSDAGYQGTGAEEDPYVISDSESLWEVADCSLSTSGLAAYFSISNDINVSEAVSAPTHSPIGLTYDPTSDPVVLQWTAFFGVLRGNGHTISGISMSSETAFVGLFAQMYDATVENLAIAGTFSTAAETYGTLPQGLEDFGTGALAALSSGHLTLSGVVNSASVIASGMVGVGGLIGASNGFVRVHSSSNLANVSGSDAVGGLIGKSDGAFLISESTNRGEVSGTYAIGGLLGWTGLLGAPASESQIVDSSNHGSITGEFAGGLVGEFDGIFTNMSNETSTTSLLIQNSQNTATVSGATVIGGLVGHADFVDFYNSGNTGPISGSNGVGGLFGGYVSFDDPFNPQSNIRLSDGTPDLGISSREPLAVPSKVTVQGSFNSGTVNGRDNVGGLVGASSGSHIAFSTNSGIVSGRYGAGGLIGSIYGDGEISSASNQSRVDGGWGTSGLIGSIISDDPASVAVRFSNNSGVIHSTFGGAGGLVGQTDDNLNLVIFKSTNNGDITGGAYLGGLVGEQEDGVLTIESSQNNGNVTSSRNNNNDLNSYDVGGLVGSSTATTYFSESLNTGDVTGENEGVGGLIGIGYWATYFIDSRNEGDVLGSEEGVGGLIGIGWDTQILRSHNLGAAHGDTQVGGLIGLGQNVTTISSSTNQGTVSATTDFAGGLVGYLDEPAWGNQAYSVITSSNNSGAVSGRGYVGGLVGLASVSSIAISFNSANVTGASLFVGGIVGHGTMTSLENNYNIGSIYGQGNVGGLLGYASTGSAISYSFNAGSVSVGGSYNNPVGDVDGVVGDSRSGMVITSVFSIVDSRYVPTSTTTELQRVGTFIGFDFSSANPVWGFGSCGDNGGFPMLRVFVELTDYNSIGCVALASSPNTTAQQPGASGAAAYSGPTLDPIQPRGVIGSELVLTGQKLSSVTSIRIGGVLQVITSATERSIRFTVSAETKLGSNDIALVSSFGTLTLQSAIQIESPSTSVTSATKSALIGKTRLLSKNAAVNQSWFAANLKDSGIVRIACTVLVSPNATHHQRVQARKQASRVCAQAAGHLERASVWFQTRETTRSRMPGRALITFRG